MSNLHSACALQCNCYCFFCHLSSRDDLYINILQEHYFMRKCAASADIWSTNMSAPKFPASEQNRYFTIFARIIIRAHLAARAASSATATQFVRNNKQSSADIKNCRTRGRRVKFALIQTSQLHSRKTRITKCAKSVFDTRPREHDLFFIISRVCFYCWFAVKCILICKSSKHVSR